MISQIETYRLREMRKCERRYGVMYGNDRYSNIVYNFTHDFFLEMLINIDQELTHF